MAQTLAERIVSIETAITAIETGAQSYQVNGRTFTRATLKTLYDERRELVKEIADESVSTASGSGGGGRRTVADF
jgi:hypothetical protein